MTPVSDKHAHMHTYTQIDTPPPNSRERLMELLFNKYQVILKVFINQGSNDCNRSEGALTHRSSRSISANPSSAGGRSVEKYECTSTLTALDVASDKSLERCDPKCFWWSSLGSEI